MTDALWQLGGWTMLHFLWLGTGVALAGGAVRFACRRAAPGVRYTVSLAVLALLAALPLGIAGYLWNPVTPRYSEGSGLSPGSTPFTLSNTPTSVESPQVIDLAFEPPAMGAEATSPAALPRGGSPSPSPARLSSPQASLQGRGITIATIVATLPWVWLAGAPITFALLAAGLVGSERLRRTSAALVDGPAAACERLRQAMGIARRVSVAVCDGVAQPVLVGIVRPLILLSAAALSGWTPAELEMVLLHELAHVRRWDNLVNLVQRVVESALFFHPAVWLVSRQVRRDREECCDAMVVARTERPHDYAALLVSIAATLRRGQAPPLAAASAMADHPLTGRVRRILKLEDEPMWISRRTLGLTVLAPLALAAATLYATAAVSADEKKPAPSNTTEEKDASTELSPPQMEDLPSETRPAFHVFKLKDSRASLVALNLEEYFEKEVTANGDGPKLRFIWEADTNQIVVQNASDQQLEVIRKLVEIYDLPSTKPSRGEVRKPSRVSPDAQAEATQLQAEIARLEGYIAKVHEDLTNLEVFKQLSLQSGNPAAGKIEKAIAEALENDPTFASYEQKLLTLQEAIQQRQKTTRNPNDPQLKQLVKQMQQVQQEMTQHAAAAKKEVRQQIAPKMLNEVRSAAEREYKIRVEAAKANLAKHAAELEEAKSRLAEFASKLPEGKDGDEQLYSLAYPAADLEKVDFQRWMLLMSSDDRIAVRWFDENKSLVVKAPRSGHERLAEFLKAARAETGDAGVKAIEFLEKQKPAVSPPATGNPQPAEGAGKANPFEDVIHRSEAPVGLPVQPHEAAASPPAWPPRAGSRESYFYSAKPGSRETTYLYDGKTFDDWRSLWKNELKTERRIEAIEALAAFGRAGQAKEAAEAIFEVADQYDVTAGLSDVEGKLVEKVVNVVALLPTADWMPLVLDRLANADSGKKLRWQNYAAAFLNRAVPRPEDRELAMKFAEHADGELTVSLASYALRGDPELADPGTVELVRKGLRDEPTDLSLLYRLNYKYVDKAPEQIALLMHEEAGARARDYVRHLAQDRPGLAVTLTDPLLAVLDDPERQDDHVAALRALRRLSSALRHRDMQEYAVRVVERLGRLLQEGGDELAVPAYVALYHVKKNASMENLAEVLLKEGVLTADRAEKLQGIDYQAFIDESNEE